VASRLHQQNKTISQELAILKEKVESSSKQKEQDGN
jgi:hypothetical protein